MGIGTTGVPPRIAGFSGAWAEDRERMGGRGCPSQSPSHFSLPVADLGVGLSVWEGMFSLLGQVC